MTQMTLLDQAEEALKAMWKNFGDLEENEMLGMPCKGALIKCKKAIEAIKEHKSHERN